ncbi:MAG TPA: hypothetical protein VJ717_03265 [Gemmatimonadaceae bacterium]|nr:hypothetical protein [Gemmatimonadaceae bacterium]
MTASLGIPHAARRPGWAPWVRGALLGALLGLTFLGIGGRIAMRAIATTQGAPTGFSVGGTFTVIMLGAVSGLVAGLLYTASRVMLRRHPPLARIVFGGVLLAITLRGLNPVDTTRLLLFLPLFVVFGVALDRLWEPRSDRTAAIR